MTSKQKISVIIKRLKKEFPEIKTALHFTTPFEIVVATILSAQTTDAHVNKVTAALFKKYRTMRDYAEAPLDVLKKDVSSVNFFNNKAKNIQGCARMLLENFQGKIPKTMEELTALPGIARKTANIVLSNVYGINEGIAVDTHVKRLAFRLGLSKHTDPVKIERDLMAAAPREEWANLSHLLIFHGRKTCQARRPDHAACVLKDICPSREI